MERFNGLVKYPDAGTPFGPVRFAAGNGGWWIQCAVKGDSGFGYWYKDLHELVRRWRVTVVAFEHGVWKAEPLPRIHSLLRPAQETGNAG